MQSMPVTIYGRKNSSNVQKVLWCCDELDLPFKRIDMGREFGGNKEPLYLAINPNGLVPTIDDGAIRLWESNAIIRYLARKHHHQGLAPVSLEACALADQWMDWQLSTLGPAFTPMFHGLVRQGPAERHWDEIRASRDATAHCLNMLDSHLALHPYVAGNAFSVADIPVGIYAYRWNVFDEIERERMPHLEAWYERLRHRPAYRRHIMVGLA